MSEPQEPIVKIGTAFTSSGHRLIVREIHREGVMVEMDERPGLFPIERHIIERALKDTPPSARAVPET